MIAAGLLCFGLTHSCRLMKQAEFEQGWPKRLVEAPGGAYLAIEVKLKHEGERIEGVDCHYTHTGIAWGHRFMVSSLVFTAGQDPYLLRSDAAPSVRMATKDYPHLTPSEALLNVVGEVLVSGYDLKGVLVDADPANLCRAPCHTFLWLASDALATPKLAIKVKRFSQGFG